MGARFTACPSCSPRARSQGVSMHQMRPAAARASARIAGIVELGVHAMMASLEQKGVVGALQQLARVHSAYSLHPEMHEPVAMRRRSWQRRLAGGLATVGIPPKQCPPAPAPCLAARPGCPGITGSPPPRGGALLSAASCRTALAGPMGPQKQPRPGASRAPHAARRRQGLQGIKTNLHARRHASIKLRGT
jgi:hypothetical protein